LPVAMDAPAMDAYTSSTDGGRRGAALPVPEKRSRDGARPTSPPCRQAAVTKRRFELRLALNRRRSAAEGHAGGDRAPPREFRRPAEEAWRRAAGELGGGRWSRPPAAPARKGEGGGARRREDGGGARWRRERRARVGRATPAEEPAGWERGGNS
jgi:hypothetical protein